MVVSSTPMSIHSSGQIVASAPPTEFKGVTSNVAGGLLNAAAAKTAASITEQASHARAAGVTMKGGGTVINVPPTAEGGTVPGVSFAGNHANLIGIANQLKAGAVYDGLVGSQPYKVGGRRRHGLVAKGHRRRTMRGHMLIPEQEPAMMAGRKHTSKTKKHGRRRNSRTHRRKLRKHLRHSRRISRRIIKR